MSTATGGPHPSHNGSPQRGAATRGSTLRSAARRDSVSQGSPGSATERSLTPSESAQWYDEDAGPLVRLYALTRGRARADDLVFSLLTMVNALSGPYDDPTLGPEQARVLALCRNAPQSVAEIAASCELPLGVTRVLLGDLLEIGHIRVRQPAPPADIFDERILQEVIDGLRAL